MRFIIFAETPELQKECLPDSVTPKRVSNEIPIYQYENYKHILDIIEFTGSKAVKVTYANRCVIVNAPASNNYQIFLSQQPCLIVVHHWGRRGVTFEFNDQFMTAVLLKIDLKSKWRIVLQNPCVAVTSGGSDPISELVQSFFQCRANLDEKCCRIEHQLIESCQKMV